METRNLTIVISNQKPVVAQYCQWDGHPDGQGVTALKFLKTMDLKEFEAKLSRCKYLDDAKKAELDKFFERITADPEGWMTPEQAQMYHKTYPLLTFDLGAGVLQGVYDTPEDVIWLRDEIERITDGRSTEWVYVIDLDTEVFEVYDGYNFGHIPEGHRFYKRLEHMDVGQYLQLVKTYDINNLPTQDEFLNYFERRSLDEH